jgi:hypothetical protein
MLEARLPASLHRHLQSQSPSQHSVALVSRIQLPGTLVVRLLLLLWPLLRELQLALSLVLRLVRQLSRAPLLLELVPALRPQSGVPIKSLRLKQSQNLNQKLHQ